MKSLLWILLICILLPACKPNIHILDTNTGSSDKAVNEPQSTQITLDDVLKAEKLIAVKNENTLFVIDPDFPKPVSVYGFDQGELPGSNSLDSFKVSPSKQWVAWYSPLKGVVALHINTLKTKVVHPADDFLSTYPYIEFLPNSDVLLCITDKGNTFLQTELNSFTQKKVDIPYPYGNVFKVSPDQQKVVFVSGFGQSRKPKFLVTSLDGAVISQFEADINMTDRHMVFWSPNSEGIFLIQNNILKLYSIGTPDSSTNFFSFSKEISINSAVIADSVIYLSTDDGYWHIIDTNTQKEVARAPLDIASELHAPKFYPWGNKQFLIEETVNDIPSQYNRLWLSDLRGVKKLLMDRYNQAIMKTLPDRID